MSVCCELSGGGLPLDPAGGLLSPRHHVTPPPYLQILATPLHIGADTADRIHTTLSQ